MIPTIFSLVESERGRKDVTLVAFPAINLECQISNIVITYVLLILNYSHIIMSSFLSRYGRTVAVLCGVTALASCALWFYYFRKKKQANVDELIGLERRRREKLVELRDKLVCYNLSMLSCFFKLLLIS